MTCNFREIGRNNRSDIVSLFSLHHRALFIGITRNPEVLFYASLVAPLILVLAHGE